MSELVLDALRALGPRPSLEELEQVAAALRKSRDSEVLVLFGLDGASGRETYERFIALVQDRDETLQFTGLDVFSEVTSPGGQRRVRERGRLVEDP